MKLLIVIVNYHGLNLTRDCLVSLRDELRGLPGVRVGLCENGSGLEEAIALRALVSELGMSDTVDLTELFPNRGFTGGNNAVIRPALASESRPEFVLLLNNDTIVLPGAIEALLGFMQSRPDVGMAGSRLEYRNGQSQIAARRILTAASEFESQVRLGAVSRLLSNWVITPRERLEPHETGWVPGAALMIRREVLELIGLLDEDLYTYFDDVDLCLRARKAGWTTWYVPHSRIVHLVGQTTGVTSASDRPKRRPRYWFLARRHYFLKNFGPWYSMLADAAAISGQAIWQLRCLCERKKNPDSSWMLWDYIRNSVFVTGFRLQPVPNPAYAPQEAREVSHV